MIWLELNALEQWNALWNSNEKFIVFKHSTRCSISIAAVGRFERQWSEQNATPVYLLDLLNHREISNAIATDSGIVHESPQCFLIENKQVLAQATHSGIFAEEFTI
ncbi:MAG: bacillithiol system redox-active protein YtxJ [Bacteroidota bacterium]|jgi:bacillithiol system protein YtxJ